MTKEEAIEEIKRWTPILLNSGQCTEKTSEAQDMAVLALSENIQGEWIDRFEEGKGYICSVCGEMLPHTDEYDYTTDFCPDCRATMKGIRHE